MNQVVSEKSDLTGKIEIFAGFCPECSTKTLEKNLQTSLKHFKVCQTNLIRVIPFLISRVFSKMYRVSRCGYEITVFAAKNGEQIFILRT